MSIDVMKQALADVCGARLCEVNSMSSRQEMLRLMDAAITALRTAIEQAERQEAWKPSDTAYRPQGLPQDFTKHEVDAFDDWSEWVCPDPAQYFMKCCGCGLVHEMQFKIVKYSEGDECEAVDDPAVQAVFRARQFEDSEKQEPVAWLHRWKPSSPTIGSVLLWQAHSPHGDDVEVTPLYITPPAAQRQPLTPAQLIECMETVNVYGTKYIEFARAIERAHGIGGGE